jgi:hypothetical protein
LRATVGCFWLVGCSWLGYSDWGLFCTSVTYSARTTCNLFTLLVVLAGGAALVLVRWW